MRSLAKATRLIEEVIGIILILFYVPLTFMSFDGSAGMDHPSTYAAKACLGFWLAGMGTPASTLWALYREKQAAKG